MKIHKPITGRVVVAMTAALLGLLTVTAPAPAQMMVADDFVPIVEQGFGDRYNSFTWSMKWWNGKLFVGTLRSNYCVQQATIVRWLPTLSFMYPPSDADFGCTPDPVDLPLRAEIWRWTPETGIWDRVYRSPQDIQVPSDPTRTASRDLGFRTMVVHRDANGAEAMYVGGFCTETFIQGVNPPSLLRSTDGETFEPVPQEPGTFLASHTIEGFPYNGFRSLQVHDDRVFAVASSGYAGNGNLIESATPSAGNDTWHLAAPGNQVFYQLASYNGFLYAGQADVSGFFLVKTDAQGSPPYDFEVVIPQGGYLTPNPSAAVVSMFEYKGFLYLGMDRPAEIYRVNPDDSWELVCGESRMGPNGMIYPLTGLGPGFDNPLALHIWRMQDAYGVLYAGTMDQTTKWMVFPFLAPILAPVAGFDLYGTENGYYYSLLTRNGLLTTYDEGMRQFAYSPEHGLIAGSANNRFGCNVWQAMPDVSRPAAPQQLDAEQGSGWVLLSWGSQPQAVRYNVYRSILNGNDRAYRRIATTFEPYFGDAIAASSRNPVHYFVKAETASGEESGPSNVVRAPFLGKRPTFTSLRADLVSYGAAPELLVDVDNATALLFNSRDYAGAVTTLVGAFSKLRADPTLVNPSWRSVDAEAQLARMARRAQIVNRGYLPWWWLLF